MPSQTTEYELQLIAKIRHFDFEFLDPVPVFPGIDKWLSASAMQKAIRRNQPELAMSAALSLLYNDSNKLWSRLKVIAMEDVSPTVYKMTNDLMVVANQHSWRKKALTCELAVKYFIVHLCEAHKSRVANDLLYTSNHHPKYKEIASDLSNFSQDDLADIYLDQSQASCVRAIAAWYMCGVQSRNYYNMQHRKGDWRFFLSLHDPKGFPELLLDTMHKGFGGGEGHSRTYALSWLKISQAKNVSFRNENRDTPFVSHWKSEAFDVHTRIGQICFRNIIKFRNDISVFLNKYLPNENHMRILGMSVFALEGMCLHSREIFGGVKSLLSEATESYVSDFNLVGEMKDHFFEVVYQNFDLIHVERKKLAKELLWISA